MEPRKPMIRSCCFVLAGVGFVSLGFAGPPESEISRRPRKKLQTLLVVHEISSVSVYTLRAKHGWIVKPLQIRNGFHEA